MTPTQDDIRQLAKGRVLVIGDAMVDHYVSGRVSRVSDEAPVPIVHVSDERWTAGGAANVAANIAALGGRAMLVGVTGSDPAASTLAGILGGMAGAVEAHLVADLVGTLLPELERLGMCTNPGPAGVTPHFGFTHY